MNQKVVKGLLLCYVFCCVFSLCSFAQGEKPMYLSLSYGSDRNLEKSDRILSAAPTLFRVTFEKRLPDSEFYGLGVNAYRFTSIFENYNHLSLRGYQHFGIAGDAREGNFDPYIGAFVGLENYQKGIKPAVGFFVGMRIMLNQMAGIHVEFSSVSSGYNSSTLLQFGVTTCLMKKENPRFRKWGNKCPK